VHLAPPGVQLPRPHTPSPNPLSCTDPTPLLQKRQAQKRRHERQQAAEALLDPDLKRQRLEKKQEKNRQAKKRCRERQQAAEALDPDLKRQRLEKEQEKNRQAKKRTKRGVGGGWGGIEQKTRVAVW
jgi:hypothetical protein